MPNTSISMSFSLLRAYKEFCQDYSMSFSKLVRKALAKYLDEIKEDSEELEILRFTAKLEQLDEEIDLIRGQRDRIIRDGSGVREIKDLRVSGKTTIGFDHAEKGNHWQRGMIKDPEEREIYEKSCVMIEEYNEERKEIYQKLLEKLKKDI